MASQSFRSGTSGATTPSAIISGERNTSIDISRPFSARHTDRNVPRTTRIAKSSRDPWAATMVPRLTGSHRTLTGDRPQRLHWCATKLRARPQRFERRSVCGRSNLYRETGWNRNLARSRWPCLPPLGFGRQTIATAVPTGPARDRAAIWRTRQPRRGRRGAGATVPWKISPSSCPLSSELSAPRGTS